MTTIHTTTNRLIAAAKVLQATMKVSLRPGTGTRHVCLEMKGNTARLSCGDGTIVLIQELPMDSPDSAYRCLFFDPQVFSGAMLSIKDRRGTARMTIQGNLVRIEWGQGHSIAIEGKDERPWPFWTYANPYEGDPEANGKTARYNTERLWIFFDAYKILNGKPPKGDLDIFMRGRSLPGIVDMGSGSIGLIMPLNIVEDPKIPQWLEKSGFAREDLCGKGEGTQE